MADSASKSEGFDCSSASPTTTTKYQPKTTELSLEEIRTARAFVESVGHVKWTPLLSRMEQWFPEIAAKNIQLHFKCENMQTTGSFKIRGATYQFHRAAECMSPGQELICFSGGNYGRAFAYTAGKLGFKGTVLMPDTVGPDRVKMIEQFGAKVEVHPYNDIAGLIKDRCQKFGYQYLDPFDDINLVRAYGMIALEILEDLNGAVLDIVLVCCGGGGLLSGIAAGFRLSGHKDMKIYGVEPVTANTMARSFREQRVTVAELPTSKSIAVGLVPVRSGDVSYPVSRRYVDDMIEITDEDIVYATNRLVDTKMIVELSGSACLAAVLADKIPGDIEGKRIVLIVSGGNTSLDSLNQYYSTYQKPN